MEGLRTYRGRTRTWTSRQGPDHPAAGYPCGAACTVVGRASTKIRLALLVPRPAHSRARGGCDRAGLGDSCRYPRWPSIHRADFLGSNCQPDGQIFCASRPSLVVHRIKPDHGLPVAFLVSHMVSSSQAAFLVRQQRPRPAPLRRMAVASVCHILADQR